MHRLILLILFIGSNAIHAQTAADLTFSNIEGYWEGAFIKGNSYQKIEVQFFESNGNYLSLQIMEEWHPQFGEFEIPVDIDSLGNIAFNTGHGRAVMQLDENNLEMVGYLEEKDPTVHIHLKKVPPPPPPNYLVEQVAINNGAITLYGHHHYNKIEPYRSALIIVGGRGCYAGSTSFDLNAKILREYGMSVFAFNKRGTGLSNGDCKTATISDFADDVTTVVNYLKNHPHNYEFIGAMGLSAGGWVINKAEEQIDFDFMISVVGPATSVREQQYQALSTGAGFYDFSPEVTQHLTEYMNLVFDAPANETSFKEMNRLLALAEKEDWMKMLADTDIPYTADEIESLWVRRHAYDPGTTLKTFNKPMLAVFGEIDWIVPYQPNLERLEQYFSGERADLLTTLVIPNAEHGTEVSGDFIDLPNGDSYWRFYRISPWLTIEVIDFLKTNNFID
ncbi:MAG: alpha/beta hydrolase [Balneolaceae bacterium]|nr:alpha/beta hydrolase [Balneolaceae bacterium]